MKVIRFVAAVALIASVYAVIGAAFGYAYGKAFTWATRNA